MALLCLATLCFSCLAASPTAVSLGLSQIKESESILGAPAKDQSTNATATSAPVQNKNITLLRQDSGTNLSEMNRTYSVSPTYGSAQAVKFTSPKPGWRLEAVLVMATDGWNSSSKQLPTPLPFAIEIRDANLRLLYHFADTQLPYFTSNTGVRMAVIEVPALPIDGDFFVCFYGYRSLGLATELQNATGNSHYFEKQTGLLYPGVLILRNNQTLPVNFIIRAFGE